jgi:hypothetical protein
MFTTATKNVRPLLLLALTGSLACATSSPPASALPRDPQARQSSMEHVRRQILHQTADVPAQRYAAVVRPDLQRQLRALGFTPPEIAVILARVDPARGAPALDVASSPPARPLATEAR